MQEINSAAQTISYVYLPDGTQLSTLIGSPKWRHETPAGTGLYETFQSGFVNRVEFDPVRANVGLTAPPPPDTNGGDGDIGSNHNGGPTDSRFSDMSNPAAGCYDIGGAFLPCTWSSLDVFEKFVWGPARNGAVARDTSIGKWVPAKRVVPINIPNPFDQYVDVPPERIDTTYTPGYWIYALAPSLKITFGNPQKAQKVMVPIRDLDQLKGLMQDRLDYGGCKSAVNDLISQLAKNAPKNQPVFDNVMSVFEKVRSQGGFRLNVWPKVQPPGPLSPGGSGFSFRQNDVWINGEYLGADMKVWIYVKGAYTDSPDLSFDRLPYDYGITGIHEMLHQIGKFMYSEAELDKAASDLGSKGVDTYLKANCVPLKFR